MSATSRGHRKDRVAGHDARIVIDDGGQPRPLRLTVGIENQDIELGVVGLPGRIGSFRPMPINELESVPVRCMTFMRQGDQCRIEGADNRVNAAVCGGLKLPLPRDCRDPSMNGGDGWARFAQSEAFDETDKLLGNLGRPPSARGMRAKPINPAAR